VGGGVESWVETHVDRLLYFTNYCIPNWGGGVKIPGQVFDPWPGSPYRFVGLHIAVSKTLM
jgi:hypothetical protein